jgi:nucleoside-diphosphate-sugar epimerase
MNANYTMKKILVTGSSGFVGKALIKRMSDRKLDVMVADIENGVDLSDKNALDNYDMSDVVVHLAARVFVQDAFNNPALFYIDNICSTINVLEYCRRVGVKKIIFASSYIYGNPEYLPINETHPANIKNPYGRSKLIGEALCLAYYEDYGIIPIILRPFNIYGIGQNENFLIPMIINQMLSDGPIIVKDLEPKRDYIYIEDIIDLYEKCVLEYEPVKPLILNAGTGMSYSVAEVIEMVMDIAGKRKDVLSQEEKRKAEVLNCYADLTKIQKELGWFAKTDIYEGLKNVYRHTESLLRE